jgi:hypothetical protein
LIMLMSVVISYEPQYVMPYSCTSLVSSCLMALC